MFSVVSIHIPWQYRDSENFPKFFSFMFTEHSIKQAPPCNFPPDETPVQSVQIAAGCAGARPLQWTYRCQSAMLPESITFINNTQNRLFRNDKAISRNLRSVIASATDASRRVRNDDALGLFVTPSYTILYYKRSQIAVTV